MYLRSRHQYRQAHPPRMWCDEGCASCHPKTMDISDTSGLAKRIVRKGMCVNKHSRSIAFLQLVRIIEIVTQIKKWNFQTWRKYNSLFYLSRQLLTLEFVCEMAVPLQRICSADGRKRGFPPLWSWTKYSGKYEVLLNFSENKGNLAKNTVGNPKWQKLVKWSTWNYC